MYGNCGMIIRELDPKAMYEVPLNQGIPLKSHCFDVSTSPLKGISQGYATRVLQDFRGSGFRV